MDSETSDESSSSDYSTESSDDDGMETAEVGETKIQLPQGLCERKDIFREIFSQDTWNSLSESNQEHLRTFLPNFPENNEEEQSKTLVKLFNYEPFRFYSPLEKFHEDLKAGYFRPNIANVRKIIQKAERKEANLRYGRYRSKLKQDVIRGREKLIHQFYSLPPGVEPKTNKFNTCNNSNIDYVSHRTKRRYYQVLSSIQAKVDEDNYRSPDENYPEGPPHSISRKQRRHLNSIKNAYISSSDTIFYSTMSRQNCLDLEKYITPLKNPFYINDDNYKYLIANHKRRKLDNLDDPEYQTKGITVSDIVNRTQLPYIKNLSIKHQDNKPKKKIKKDHNTHSPDLFSKHFTSNSEIESDSSVEQLNHLKKPKIKKIRPVKVEKTVVKMEPVNNKNNYYGKITPVTLSDLEGIDMMNIPIDLDNEIDIIELNNKPELMQETHSNFLSLIRDIICSTNEHRMNLATLEDRLKSWQENPISPLNDWYSLADNWVDLLKSAINFLCGNSVEQPDDFVPYMEFKVNLDLYQWIGAGRDSDPLLATLCQYWLEHKTDNKTVKDDLDVEITDRSQTPPPPRCPTNWTVRKAAPEEIKDFREQERRRYDNPHKAFTYRCNGYESVVGPLKGIYNPAVGNAKARGHTMLNADRPNFVTILSLVRDATARLPNGEGTRAEICELLKSSQYISSTAPENVLQSVVSGALDRMHTQFDPCVKYDSKRKIWIYLHRNRSEEDFERIHQQYQGVNKKKTPKKPIKPKMKIDKKPEVVTFDKKLKVQAPSPVATNKTSLLISNNTDTSPTPTSQALKLDDDDLIQRLSPKLQQQIKNKGLVKILTPSQGKSLIIPASTAQVIKPEAKINQQINQQLIQTITNKQQQKSTIQIIHQKLGDKIEKPLLQHQQQQPTTIIPQPQLQNIKNVTLVRNASDKLQEHNIQIKTQATLTPAQQQQIIQTIRQKILPQATVLSPQQQIILKQKPGQSQLQQQQVKVAVTSVGASLLGPPKLDNTKTITSTTPVVAKVFTDSAGHVISVESLLAHQKQHGSLPQGTTLRVSGTKGGQANLIQLAGASKQNNPIAQFAAVASQNNLITLGSQPKLVVASSQSTSSITSTTATKPLSRTLNKTQTLTKFPQKVTQQLINAKLISTQNLDGQKIGPPKIFMGPQQQKMTSNNKNLTLTKPVTLTANANTIRMVSAANLNLTHIGGKPVLLASKGGAIQNIQGQNVILHQTQPNASGNNQLVLQNAVKNQAAQQHHQQQQGQVVLGPQLKMQPQVVFSSNVKAAVSVNQQQTQGHIVLEGHPVRLQTSTATNTQRVVLASQGQGGQILAQQILLPAGFQGTAINIKALQGVKVIPIAQAHGQIRGVQNRQVFARVMNPNLVKQAQTANVKIPEQTQSSSD